MNEFSKLNINSAILSALDKIEITVPTPIQEQSIPLLLEGFDVIGQAQTGTGKTFAYAIPLLSNIDDASKNVEALVLSPTRELSIQVANEIDKLASNLGKIKTCTIYGGESYEKQFQALKRKPQIVIGTPGRIIDQMNRGNLSFANVKYLVLDEADEMLKMGFQDDLDKILKEMPKERQTALFSATFPAFLKNVAKNYMNNPKTVKIENKTLTVSAIDQKIYYCKKDSKKDLLVRLLDFYQFKSVMIFSNTKAMVDELVLFLQQQGFSADGLHGDLKQGVRDRVMQSFRLSSVDILIATDVAARGIDIDGIDGIINFDIPNENEIYVHRIGRTARAGNTGTAITLATTRQKNRIAELEAFTKQKITVCEIPTVKELNTHRQKALYLKLMEGIEANKDNHEYDNLLNKLAHECSDPVPLFVTFLKMIDKDNERTYPEIETVSLKPKRDSKDLKSRRDSKNKNRRNDSNSDKKEVIRNDKQFALIEVNIGSIDNVRANQLVVFFHDELKIHREHFGKITIDKKYSLIEVNKPALKYFNTKKSLKFNGHTVTIKEIGAVNQKNNRKDK